MSKDSQLEIQAKQTGAVLVVTNIMTMPLFLFLMDPKIALICSLTLTAGIMKYCHNLGKELRHSIFLEAPSTPEEIAKSIFEGGSAVFHDCARALRRYQRE